MVMADVGDVGMLTICKKLWDQQATSSMASAVLPLVVSEFRSWTSNCVGQQTGLPPSVADWDLGLSTGTKLCLVGYFTTATEVRLGRWVMLIVPLT